jgi:hypothetical protein
MVEVRNSRLSWEREDVGVYVSGRVGAALQLSGQIRQAKQNMWKERRKARVEESGWLW